jgi:outer membrane lipoprotein-sorting protein
MKRAEDIRRVFQRAGLGLDPDADERMFQDVLQARRQIPQNPRTVFDRWRAIMRSPSMRLAMAAAVMVACGIGVSLWNRTGSALALADVLARMEEIRAFRYQHSSKMYGTDPNKPPSLETGIRWVSKEYGVKTRAERPDPNGGKSLLRENWFLPDKKTSLTLLHDRKRYWRVELGDDLTKRAWELMGDPSALTRQILKGKYGSLGRSIVDGIEVEGFRTTDPTDWGPSIREIDAKIWVDVKTRLPVRYEVTDTDFHSVRVQTVYDNFQWDVPVKASEFEPVIPEGFTGTVIKYPARITEETAIQGLRLLVNLLGRYPDAPNFDETVLKLAQKSETPAARRLQEETKGLAPAEITNRLADFLVPIRGAAEFYVRLHQEGKDPAYYGKAVTPRDADKVLLRWKLSDQEYRVIFGDLHAATVSPEKLAELEKALPK